MTAVRTGSRIFDGHFHIIDPRFPLIPNRGFIPEPFTVEDYLEKTSALELAGGAVVSGSFQGFDQSYLLDALEKLGPSFVGVTQLPGDAPDEEILSLDAAGVRAVRFNLYRGGPAKLEELENLARRVYELAGWSAELYVDSKDLPELEPTLARLPRVSVDHLGMTRNGYPAILRLVEAGMKVKATGFGRVELDVAEALREIAGVDPGALIFGTDLPGTRARRSFRAADVGLISETLGESLAGRVLHDNALEWYPRVGKGRE
ncbi:MAG: amidohydrolase family protein [Rubrobacteraceae bacterium]